jgi:hypothetical protein
LNDSLQMTACGDAAGSPQKRVEHKLLKYSLCR